MEELVIRFESGVVEVFYAGRGDSDASTLLNLSAVNYCASTPAAVRPSTSSRNNAVAPH